MKSTNRKESYSPDNATSSKEDPMLKFRGSTLKFEDRSSDLFLLRNSFSSTSLKNFNYPMNHDFRVSGLGCEKRKSFQTLKSTLDVLEDKINSAKN